MFAGVAVCDRRDTGASTLAMLRVEAADSSRWLLGVAALNDAAHLDDDALRHGTRELYNRLCEAVAEGPWCPVRFWNFIPQINQPAADGLDRYMIFNAGRYEALQPRVASLTALPTATGVGHDGQDLHVFCLASDGPAHAVENPRQCSAYRYSRRFGPRPPCFSRATALRLAARPSLIIGGTAAIRGEVSKHPTCLKGQLAETFVNLEALVERASGGRATLADSANELRVFVRRLEDMPAVEREIADRLPALRHLETMQAAICRDELLVEIEGLASLPEPAL